MSTLGFMSTNTARDDDNVIELSDYASRARGGDGSHFSQSQREPVLDGNEPVAREAASLVLSVHQSGGDGPQYRIIGINDALHVADFFTVLDTCFGCDGDAEWTVHGGDGVEGERESVVGDQSLYELLNAPGDTLDVTRRQRSDTDANTGGTNAGEASTGDANAGEGSSEDVNAGEGSVDKNADAPDDLHFHIDVAECYLRDHGTPDALCVGGDEHADLDSINAELTGAATTQHILHATKPIIRSAIERSGIFDFIPLLQALDLGRETNVDADTLALCRCLPKEKDPAGRDAAVAEIMAQAALVEGPLRADIIETMMEAIGWVADDGSELKLPEIDHLASETLQAFEHIGLTGDKRLSSLERLELCRAIIRAD